MLGRDGVLSRPTTRARLTMTTIRSVPRPSGGVAALAVAVLLAAGCGSPPATPTTSGSPRTNPTSEATPNASDPTAVPGGSANPAPSDSAGLPTQTDTEWGRIWDAVPASFPTFPGAFPTEAIEGPVSASFGLPAGPQEAAVFMQAAVETAGYSTEALSGPFEDGSYVLDSVGETPECRIQTRLTPLSGTTNMTILFGAACPFE